MKKQFYRVKQLADQTFLRAEKSEVLNNEELQIADQKVEYLRTAITAISKRISASGQGNDPDKRLKKCPEYYLASIFTELGNKKGEPDAHDTCHLFQDILRKCGDVEQGLAKEYAEHEQQVDTWVGKPIQTLLDNEFPNIAKQKRSLNKYILDKDSASNRYHSTKKEALKDDMEEADSKVEQNRDALAYEMFGLLARENEFSSLILQYLKLQRGYHESALKILEDFIPELEKKIGDSPVRRVFGIPLQEHLRVSGKRIAYPLEICISILSRNGMSEEGLFRIAGGTSRVKRFKSSIDSGCLTELIPEYQDVHVLASTLKMYLRELPEPLLTFQLHNEWIQSMQYPDNQRLDAVRRLIAKLPPENRDNLSYLIQFLAKLASHPENKMSSSNIAIVIAPNLLWDHNIEANMNMGNCATVNMLTEMFIKEADALFPQDFDADVSLPFAWRQEDEMMSTGSQRGDAASLASSHVDLNASTENIQIADSPKPNSRKKKPAAPVPPMTSKTDQDFGNDRVSTVTGFSGSSTLSRLPKSKDKVKTSVGINTDENSLSLSRRRSFTSHDDAVAAAHKDDSSSSSTTTTIGDKPLVSVDCIRNVELRHVTQPSSAAVNVQVAKAKPVQPVVAQNANCDSKNFKTTVTHQVVHQPSTQPPPPLQNSPSSTAAPTSECSNRSPKPVAAPRSLIDGERGVTVSRSSSLRSDVMSKSAGEITGSSDAVQLRRPLVEAVKPEVPARPASLQKRSSNDNNLDGGAATTTTSTTPHRTQCSVYSVANKQQASIVNLPKQHQPGHDNQIAEKERFLGHHSDKSSSAVAAVPTTRNLENKFGDINSNSKPGLPPKIRSTEKLEKLNKSTEKLNDAAETPNGNQKPSHHVRTRSDGNIIDLDRSLPSSLLQTPPSPRSLNKPTQPPPPPPVNVNNPTKGQKDPDNSTDL